MTDLTLYTIGYGNRPPAEFFALLPADCTLIDVRYKPGGWSPSYNKSALEQRLGRRYLHFPALGNASGSADIWTPPLVLAPDVPDILEALVSLMQCDATTGPVVLMCAEREANRCHRRLVAQALAERVPGLEIVHL